MSGKQDRLGGDEGEALLRTGREKAKALLYDCLTEHGFLATPMRRDNYSRIWGRDSSIIGLAGRFQSLVFNDCRRALFAPAG